MRSPLGLNQLMALLAQIGVLEGQLKVKG